MGEGLRRLPRIGPALTNQTPHSNGARIRQKKATFSRQPRSSTTASPKSMARMAVAATGPATSTARAGRTRRTGLRRTRTAGSTAGPGQGSQAQLYGLRREVRVTQRHLIACVAQKFAVFRSTPAITSLDAKVCRDRASETLRRGRSSIRQAKQHVRCPAACRSCRETRGREFPQPENTNPPERLTQPR